MPSRLPVVIIAYNRPRSLERLLDSVAKSDAVELGELHISVEGGAPEEIGRVLDRFRTRLNFRVTQHKSKLGLKSHVLWCGDLLAERGGGVLLEDDLYVSQDFCDFTLQAAAHFGKMDSVASISLYAHPLNVFCQMPFTPEMDGYDNYFLQLPCSWGQYWNTRQWEAFREWLALNPNIDASDHGLPRGLRNWSDRSWLKLFANFVVKNKLQCAYPRASLTTNFSEAGSHVEQSSNLFQVPLGRCREYKFSPSVAEGVCYDLFFERLPEQIKGIPGDCIIDLYGQKEVIQAPRSQWITRKQASRSTKTFGERLKPHEANISENLEGSVFKLTSAAAIQDRPYRVSRENIENAVGQIPGRAIAALVWRDGIRRLKNGLKLN